jgi:dipeptidyl aminopeptidase/acylaminoacyl peptidase
MRFRYLIFSILLLALISACGPAPQPAPVVATATAVADTPIPSPSKTPTLTATFTPTATLSPTSTLTPTPTLNPLTIVALRQRSYPGSDIQIEQELEPGVNYNRYIVSYLSEGLKIYALMTVPRGEKPASGWPVIIFNHGYIPPKVYTPTSNYVAHVDILARDGYIVLKPDYRGNGKSEGIARSAYGSPDYIVDDLNALASIQQYPDADTQRIGMFGHSMGGHVTLGAMVISKDIKAGVIWAGVVASYPDLMYKWEPTPVITRTPGGHSWEEQFIQQYGNPTQAPEFWASISATSYLKDLSGPLQLHHGTSDTEVPYQFSVDLYNAIQAVGKPVEFYTYKGAGHNLLNEDFSLAIYRTLQFFDEYVK